MAPAANNPDILTLLDQLTRQFTNMNQQFDQQFANMGQQITDLQRQQQPAPPSTPAPIRLLALPLELTTELHGERLTLDSFILICPRPGALETS